MHPAGIRWPAREGGGCPGRTGQERSTGGVKTDRLDPDVAALALSQSVMLRSTIESAGAVWDLVYGLLTRHAPVFRITNKMFTDAIDALGEDPDGGDFAMALGAAGTVPDEIVVEIKDIIQSEVEGSLDYMAYWGANQAVADGFSAAFPHEANALAKPSSDLPGSTARLDHLSMLAEVFHAAVNKGSLGWPLKGRAGEAFEPGSRRGRTAGSRRGVGCSIPGLFPGCCSLGSHADVHARRSAGLPAPHRAAGLQGPVQ